MMKTSTILCIIIILFSILVSGYLHSQGCTSAEIISKENFQYGRFEVAMQSAPGDGIVSSFFLYNIDAGCEWPINNNEIDIEMTGNNDKIYFTTHHPGEEVTWFYGDTFEFSVSPHETFNDYAIEWEPGFVRWFVNGELIYVQDEPAAEDLVYPMAILMNIWAADFVDWVGVWDPSVMPQAAKYDYVKYYRYTPGNGNVGTDNNFQLEWEDDFQILDTSRWEIADFKQLGNSYCDFRTAYASVSDGILELKIDEAYASDVMIPVTFSVNVAGQNLSNSDKVYLNGTFNDWCGSCYPMKEEGDIWSLTLSLSPGRYEYLFTINGWEISGGAPAGSSCDYLPCDEYTNYGFLLSEEEENKVLTTYCWGECTSCMSTSTNDLQIHKTRKLLGIYDLMGRKVEAIRNQVLIYVYDNGSIEKKIHLEY